MWERCGRSRASGRPSVQTTGAILREHKGTCLPASAARPASHFYVISFSPTSRRVVPPLQMNVSCRRRRRLENKWPDPAGRPSYMNNGDTFINCHGIKAPFDAAACLRASFNSSCRFALSDQVYAELRNFFSKSVRRVPIIRLLRFLRPRRQLLNVFPSSRRNFRHSRSGHRPPPRPPFCNGPRTWTLHRRSQSLRGPPCLSALISLTRTYFPKEGRRSFSS